MSSDAAGGTNDVLARAGEGTSVRILDRRCPRCGARMEEIVHAYTQQIVATQCRGGCKDVKDVRFQIPPGARASQCRSPECGAKIYWIKTKAGKLMPVDPDGTSHFVTCANAAAWRKG